MVALNLAGKLVVIVGETASGKSAVALDLAKKFNGEIICADSWTVRKGVNIGTAKPTLNDRKQVPHHLLDEVESCGEFTAAVFKRRANQAIKEITGRGKLPIIVGGTGLYVDGVVYDYGFLSTGNRQARRKLNEMTASELTELAHARGLSTTNIDIRNKRRIIRLIETDGEVPRRRGLRPNTLLIGLKIDRDEHDRKIEKRVDYMLKAGLEDEARTLSKKYGWDCEALKGIGYKEWREYFDGSVDLHETRQRIISSTRQLAKRQRTWFKRNKSIHWMKKQREVVEIVTTFLSN